MRDDELMGWQAVEITNQQPESNPNIFEFCP
jgi:hypothetical protein